jgi:hypothetical protein
MNRTRSVDNATDPGKPIRGIATPSRHVDKLSVESDLSPERIVDGASATTAVLAEILAQQDELHQIRDWGINE